MLLIVDHDPQLLEAAARLVGPNEVWFAGSIEHARSLIACVGGSLSLALVDLELPDGEGPAFIRDLRESFPDLPVIAVSGTSARIVGEVDVLRKPVTSEWRATIARARLARSA